MDPINVILGTIDKHGPDALDMISIDCLKNMGRYWYYLMMTSSNDGDVVPKNEYILYFDKHFVVF